MSHPGVSEMVPDLDWEKLLLGFRRAPPSIALAAMRTWFNSWSTTDRVHSGGRSSCRFCGLGKDNLQHTIVCPSFWRICAKGFDLDPYQESAWSNRPLLEKLALASPFPRPNPESPQGRLLEDAYGLAIAVEFFTDHLLGQRKLNWMVRFLGSDIFVDESRPMSPTWCC